MTPAFLDDLWRQQSVWSQTADRMKSRIERARLAALLLVVAAAIAGTSAAALSDVAPSIGKVLAGVAAAASAALPFLRPAWSGKRLKDWTRARSVSEALKTDVHLWLAGARPYGNDPHAYELRKRTDALRVDAADLVRYQTGITAVDRGLPAVSSVATYFAVRVAGQIDGYYARKAEFIQRRIKLFRVIEIALSAAGAVMGTITAVFGGPFAAWIAVVATIGTALSVHVSATRYEFQLIEFLRTAERLRQLKSRSEEAGLTHQQLLRLVRKGEDVISVENQGWMAKLAEDPAEQAVKQPESDADAPVGSGADPA
jgi:SMODS and SLOG-associating 2TM effector domain 1/Protein of unknown function (DUF4231)